MLLLFCALPSAHSQIPSYIPTNGLVGWWPFNGNANDESGFGNNGSINGATLTTDKNNQLNRAFSFNGTSHYITIGNQNNFQLQNYITISTWIFMSGGTQNPRIIQFGNDNYNEYGIETQGTSNVSRVVNGYFGGFPSNATLSSGTWHHVVYVCNRVTGNSKLYFNGNLASEYTGPSGSNLSYAACNLTIGRKPCNNTDYFGGKIDDVGLWNRVLSDQEIRNLYNQSCTWNINPVINGNSSVYIDSAYTYSVQQQNGRTYQWSIRNGGSIIGSSTNSSVQIRWDTTKRDTVMIRETDILSGCYKDTMLIVQSRFPLYYSAQWVNTAPRIIPNPTNGMSCYPGTPNCVGGSIDSITIPGSRMVTYGVFNAKPDTIQGINPVLPTVRFQIVYRDNGDIIHDSGPLGSDRVSYTSSIGLVKCRLGPFTYDYRRELSLKVISPNGTQTTDIVSLLKANGDLYIIPE